MRVPKSVIAMIADLRSHLQENLEPPVYVSDRRLVKAIAMLQVKHSPAWPWGSGLGFRFSGSKRGCCILVKWHLHTDIGSCQAEQRSRIPVWLTCHVQHDVAVGARRAPTPSRLGSPKADAHLLSVSAVTWPLQCWVCYQVPRLSACA